MKYLIINADDFGQCTHINQAIVQAHRQGILTSASLMVNGEAFEEAITLAKNNPALGVGLHLVLAAGKATLPPHEIPDLVDKEGNFTPNAVRAGMRYYFSKKLYGQIQAEVVAQIKKFLATGLPLDHINGHLNIHMHPVVLQILLQNKTLCPDTALRATSEPLMPTLRLDTTNWGYKISHAFIFGALGRYAKKAARSHKIMVADAVYGLLQSGRMTQDYLIQILPTLPDGIYEFYFHPALANCPEIRTITPQYLFAEELAALISPQVRQAIAASDFQLARYGQLQERSDAQ